MWIQFDQLFITPIHIYLFKKPYFILQKLPRGPGAGIMAIRSSLIMDTSLTETISQLANIDCYVKHVNVCIKYKQA
jgi:hypothetical protein